MRRSVFVFAVLLLIAAALYAATSMWMALARLDRLDGAGEAMLRAEESRTLAQGLLASAVDIETATRGFVLSGDAALLIPLDDARARAPHQLDALRDHVRADPEQLSRLNRVTRELAESLTLSELIVERRRGAPGTTEAAGELGDRAMTATKSIRGLVEEIDATQTQRLASARAGWAAELRDARTVEIATGALTLVVVGLAAWVLARLRRLGRRTDAAVVGDEAREASMRGVGMHLTGALDATDRLQAATGASAAAAARLDPLRSGIEGALDEARRVVDDAVPDAVHRGALDEGLHELARRAGARPGTVVREAIDAHAQPIDPAQARLLYRAAEWAERLLMRRPRDGELFVGLTTTSERAEVQVEGPCAWDGPPNELDAAERRAYERLAAEVAAAGGACHWTADTSTGRLHASVLRTAVSGPSGGAR